MIQPQPSIPPLLARQPILDRDRQTCAYELLFRGAATGTATHTDGRQATARVLINALNSVGMNTLIGRGKAYINCDRSMLLENVFETLDPRIFVLEILETVIADPAVIKAIGRLKRDGFKIALDDFILTDENLETIEPFLPFTDQVKIDLLGSTDTQLIDSAQFFQGFPAIKLLAEKVETNQQFEHCKRLGFTLFQGYFFARPEIISGRTMDPKIQSVVRILQMMKSDPDLDSLEDAFKAQPELTIALLKFINSASIGMRMQIQSIRNAITQIGRRKLEQWLLLLLFANSNPSANGSSSLMNHAVQRARFMENLSGQLNPDQPPEFSQGAFLTGMFSCMDALCNVSVETIVAEFALTSDIAGALLHHEGFLGELLKLAKSVEKAEFNQIEEQCEKLGCTASMIKDAQSESWAWMESNRT